jgi:hypothetical protein
MWKRRLAIVTGVLILLTVVVPFATAYRDSTMSGIFLGTRNGHTLHCYIVDGVITDRYRLLVYDESFEGKIRYSDGALFVDGQRVKYVDDQNVAWLDAQGTLAFDAIGVEEVESGAAFPDRYWLFGSIPSFKSFPRSARPREEYIDAGVAKFLSRKKVMSKGNHAVDAAKSFSDDPRIFGYWQSEDINGHPDNPMWAVHEYCRDGTVAIATVWIENEKVERLDDGTLNYTFHDGRLSIGRRNNGGSLETDKLHWWEQPIRFDGDEFQYDYEDSPGIATWKKIESIEAVDRNRR